MKCKLFEGTDAFETIISAFFLVIIVLDVTLQIAVRTFGINISMTEEVARYAQVWMVYIGMAGAVHTNSHIGLMLFEKRLSINAKIVRRIIIGMLSTMMFVFLTYAGMILCISSIKSGASWYSVPELPYFINHIALPLGSFLGVFRIIQVTIRDIKKIRSYGSTDDDMGDADKGEDTVKCSS